MARRCARAVDIGKRSGDSSPSPSEKRCDDHICVVRHQASVVRPSIVALSSDPPLTLAQGVKSHPMRRCIMRGGLVSLGGVLLVVACGGGGTAPGGGGGGGGGGGLVHAVRV